MFPPTFDDGFHDRECVERMKYTRLGETDMIVSNFGYGAAALGNVYKDDISKESKEAFLLGLRSGINYIDTAPWYGQGLSEKRIGEYLKTVPRSVYYLATKVGRYELDPKLMFDFSAKKTKESVEKSLELLGLDYIDLIQIHDIEFAESLEEVIKETLPALLELKTLGKVKYIGITSYNLNVLKKMVRLSPKGLLSTVLSYAKLSIINQELSDDIQVFERGGLGVINAAPTGMGLLTEFGTPDWHPAPSYLKKACAEAALFCKSKGFNIASLANLWALNSREVATTLISSPTMDIMRMNLSLSLQREISPEETSMIKEIQVKFFDYVPIVNWDLVEAFKLRNT